MKKLVIILCFLTCIIDTSAQQYNGKDSLDLTQYFNLKLNKTLAKGDFNDAFTIADSVIYYAKRGNKLLILADAYEVKAEIYKHRKESEKSIAYIKKTIPIYQKYDLKSNLINIYTSLSSAYRPKGRLDSVSYFLNQADKYVTDTSRVKALQYLYNQKSLYHENTARLDSAIHYVFKRIAITDSLSHYRLGNANLRLSNLFFKVSDYPKSLTYINKALEKIEKSERPLVKTKLMVLSSKFQLLFKLGKDEEALAIANEILKIAKEKNRPDFEVFTKVMLNKFHFDNLKTKSEDYALQDSIISDKKLSNSTLFRFYLTQLDQNLQLNNIRKSQVLHNKLKILLPNIGSLSLKQSFYQISSDYYNSKSDFKASLEANKTFSKISKQINERQKMYMFYDLETKYQAEKKDKIILENKLKLEKSQAKTQKMIILTISLLLASILLWFSLQQRQKRIQQQLVAIQKEQEILTLESLIEGEEKERLRIAKELHDGVNGDLSAIKYKLLSLLKTNNTVINEAVTMIDNSCQQVRAISHNLVPPSLKDFNLIEAVSNYCENMNNIHKPNISFLNIGDSIDLSKKIEVNIFRIVQELVTNAIKHAQAKTIDVQLSNLNNTLLITVEDNGQGYKNTIEETDGIGISNIKSRADYLNANLEVVTNKNGTSNTIEIDLNKFKSS